MFKVIWLIKRKSSITHEQFREHYERSHVAMAHKYFGHLWTEYRRNYVTTAFGGSPAPDGGLGPVAADCDCVTEWIFPSLANYEELLRISADPVIGKAFHDDEANFLDRESLRMFHVEVVDTGTGDGHGSAHLAMPTKR